jgi:hypothetical protein
MRRLALIVEWHGEEKALPVLVRRILNEEVEGSPVVEVLRPHCLPRGRMVKPEHLGRAVALQSSRVAGVGGVLVVADADDDDPAVLAADITAASGAEHPVPVIAVREYEAWLLAALPSLTSHRSVRTGASWEGDPESVRGAKERLSAAMVEPYRETLHQASFSAIADLGMIAGRSPSFRNLVAAVSRLAVE